MGEATPGTARRALLKPAEVCDLLKVQPYVLRTWEKEFPELGVSRAAGGPRFYRPSDLEHAQRIKQLVFVEGLTLAGARRRIDEERAAASPDLPFDDEGGVEPAALPAEAKARIEGVRSALRSLLEMLSSPPVPRPRENGLGSAPDSRVAPAPEPVVARKRRGSRPAK